MAEQTESVFARAIRNSPWRKTDKQLIDHLSAIPIYDAHIHELLDRFVRRVNQDESIAAIPAETARQLIHVIDLSLPFWEEDRGLVDADEMRAIRGELLAALSE